MCSLVEQQNKKNNAKNRPASHPSLLPASAPQYHGRVIRRVLREMVQSAKPIIDIFLALLFYVAIFAVMGLYIFGPLKVRAHPMP